MDGLGRKSGQTDPCAEHNGVSDKATVFTDDVQESLFQLEADSWWFNYRAQVILRCMKKFFDKDTLTVDIGGGNGYTTWAAAQDGFHMQLLEPSRAACKNAADRGIDGVCGMLTKDYPEDDMYHQVLLLDVLEHIEDDRGFISLLHRKMAKEGILLLTVPAFPCLWSSEDNAAGHFRRYRMKKLCRLLQRGGFQIFYRSHFMSFLFFPVLLIRVGLERMGVLKRQEERTESEKKKIAEAQFKTSNRAVQLALAIFEQLELGLLKKSGLVPFGSSIIICAGKRTDHI